MVDPDKFSCSLLSSWYEKTLKYAIIGLVEEVDFFVKIDMWTLMISRNIFYSILLINMPNEGDFYWKIYRKHILMWTGKIY